MPCFWIKIFNEDRDHLQSELHNCYQEGKCFVVDLSGRRTARMLDKVPQTESPWVDPREGDMGSELQKFTKIFKFLN